MTIKEVYEHLKEYEDVKKKLADIEARIATEDNIPEKYYELRDLMKKQLEIIGNKNVIY